jgi:serine/threonine protein kinase
MPLIPGAKLGPYEIIAAIGAGGMGEVYRARDTRLGRDVAIKVLPQHLSSNPELKERFDCEARAISSLNHARICTLHDVGHGDMGLGPLMVIVADRSGALLLPAPLSMLAFANPKSISFTPLFVSMMFAGFRSR